ncbi:hypothetical protein ABW19_dt0205120 [Dactylella cylindrospora]|nr:hypothetical protein ABW19_dt0205120 [Dactylella cylindrospora]
MTANRHCAHGPDSARCRAVDGSKGHSPPNTIRLIEPPEAFGADPLVQSVSYKKKKKRGKKAEKTNTGRLRILTHLFESIDPLASYPRNLSNVTIPPLSQVNSPTIFTLHNVSCVRGWTRSKGTAKVARALPPTKKNKWQPIS